MSFLKIDSGVLTQMFLQGTARLSAHRDLVNALNVYPVPDGDTGTNMSLTMNAAVADIQKNAYATCQEVSKSVAKGSLMGARGNSGVILSQIFRGFSKGCEHKESLTVPEFAEAMREASDMAYRAVLKPVEGTILTVVREMAEHAVEIAEEGMYFHHFLRLVLDHGESTLNKTPDMLPVLKQAGVVDAGGKGLHLVFEGFLSVASGEAVPLETPESTVPVTPVVSHQPEVADIRFAYCTEFIVRGTNMDTDGLQKAITPLGDSMVFVADDDVIKVHIHTNNPGVVLEHGLKQGELVSIKIENMKEQHHSILEDRQQEPAAVPVEKKPYGFIAVAAGEGIAKIFKDLQVDVVIEGGQTMNPSTEDILKAVDQIHADCIYVLPNNSNIILAANQAQALSDRKIIVIPSKSIPQGIASMVHFNPDYQPEENQDRMVSALGTVKTLQVTYSVRDTQMGDLTIAKDDVLAILNSDIVAHGPDTKAVILDALNQAIDDDSEILTLYYGDAVEEAEASALMESIEEIWPDLEIEVYFGGQPVYYYLCSIE